MAARHPPPRHPRPARAGARPGDRRAAHHPPRLGAGARADPPARDAQLEHHGDRPDRDDLQHLGLLSLHRADLQEHLRQGQHLGRVHGGQPLPDRRPEAPRPVGPGDAREAQVLRRQRLADRRDPRRGQAQIQGSLRHRPDLGAAADRGPRQVDRPEPEPQRVPEGHLGQAAFGGLPGGLEARAQDHLLPAHPGGDPDREGHPRRLEIRLHPDARILRAAGRRGRPGERGPGERRSGRTRWSPRRSRRRWSPRRPRRVPAYDDMPANVPLCRIGDPECEACQSSRRRRQRRS